MVLTLLAGLTLTSNAAGTPGEYTVTFVGTNAVAQINGSTVQSATTDASGALTFSAVANAGYTVYSVTAMITNADEYGPSTAVVATGSLPTVNLTNVESNITVTIIAGVAYSGQTTAGVYGISDETGLSILSATVSGGTVSYSGSTFVLTSDVALQKEWVPIGGNCPENPSTYIPSGNYFAGVFDGNGHTVSNLSITTVNGATSYGFFGFINGGTVYNLTVSGAITLASSTVTDYVGGIVGYTNGSIYNCHSSVNIDVSYTVDEETNGGGNIGTIAGAIENPNNDDSVIKIQYCSGTGNITGARRMGGIVGGVYCKAQGGVRVDNNSYVGGTIDCVGSSKAYSGGIAGYVRGWVSRSYAYNIVLQSSGGHYICGGVGLLQGADPMASLYNSYTYVQSYVDCNSEYDRPMYGSADESNILEIYNSTWVETPTYYQITPTGYNGWGDWGQITESFTDLTDLDANYDSILNHDYPNTFVSSNNHPVLAWEISGVSTVTPGTETNNNTPGGPTESPYVDTDLENSSTIFLDPTRTDSYTPDGSKAYPYKTLSDALNALSTTRTVIYIRGQVSLTSNTSIAIPSGASYPSEALILRSSIYDGYLFSIGGTSGNSTTVTIGTGITIDGNKTAFKTLPSPSPVNSLFQVNNYATLSIGSGVTLQNNWAGNGGAIRIMGGTVAMSGGSIQSNEAALNGGAVSINNSNNIAGTFTMSGGSIVGNTAGNKGGAVGVFNYGTFTFSAGTIASNTATGNGGAVYIDAIATGTGPTGTHSTFNYNGGTITGNSAALGQGIYADWNATGSSVYNIIMDPSSGNASILITDLTYLMGTGGQSTGAHIELLSTLNSTNTPVRIAIQVADPDETRVVANAQGSASAGDSVDCFVTWNGSDLEANQNYIEYGNLDLLI